MKLKGKYSESAVLYAVILGVAAVLAVAVFFVVLHFIGGDKKPAEASEPAASASQTEETEPPKESGYEADRDLANEMFDAAADLIYKNYTVLRLYYTKGLDHKDEPYGNAPEDGYYTVDSDTYTSLEQIEEIVDSTYVKSCATEIKTNPLGYGAIYKTRENGTLGIIENYTPMPYDMSWENPQLEIDPQSDTECIINITIHNKTDGAEVPLTATMVKKSAGWRLQTVIF
ncbi:MAG: hypothetical protein J6N15_02470 [Ruminiclostridium sp.]|nr:hypothetical protein [Ruminiclostridium sp.]